MKTSKLENLLAVVALAAALAALGYALLSAIENQQDPATPGVNRAEIINNLKGENRP